MPQIQDAEKIGVGLVEEEKRLRGQMTEAELFKVLRNGREESTPEEFATEIPAEAKDLVRFGYPGKGGCTDVAPNR